MIRDVFPAVEPGSPVHGDLERLREVVASHPSLAADGDARVRADLVTRRGTDGVVRVRRFVWSVQRPDPRSPLGLAARTLVHDGSSTTVHDFPRDPVLTWLTGPDGRWSLHDEAARAEVLRYIALRRVTVRLHDVPGLPARVVAKTQSEADLRRADHVLTQVGRAVRAAGTTSFRVPTALALDTRRRLLHLDELPGRPLSRSLDELGDDDAMTRLGRIHQDLHRLDVDGLTTVGTRDLLRSAGRAAEQVATLLPSLTGQVGAVVERLARTAPADVRPVFCQGDFVPSQILCDSSGWSVIDLDDAHLADPYAEVAALVVALPRELSVKDEARAARVRERYLGAYRDSAGVAVDEERWRWHLTLARLRLAARRLVKGRAVPGETEAVLAVLDPGVGVCAADVVTAVR